ncbi:VOC family protein [Anaerocolumna sedimenticola]
MVEYAITCGAAKAKEQFSDLWTVMIDPAGHPFCFDTL